MDVSPDTLFDYRPWTPGKAARRNPVLWPVEVWRVCVPLTRMHSLNLLQRVVLRLHIAGQREYAAIARAVDAEPELIALVAGELQQMRALDAHGAPLDRAEKLLADDAPPEPDETRVGFVFRDRLSGKLLGRFALELTVARVEMVSERPVLLSGDKGNPRRERPFVVRATSSWGPPTPEEIREAIHTHLLHAHRFRRAGVLSGLGAPEDMRRIGRLTEAPMRGHLRTFVEIPTSPEAALPWLVADAFGFGHHDGFRAELEALRAGATGPLRDRLDHLTGMDDRERVSKWNETEMLLREVARDAARSMLTLHSGATFDAFADACMLVERARYAHEDERDGEARRGRAPIDMNSAYQRLRSAIEFSLTSAFERFPPGDAWLKVKDLPGRAVGQTILRHAEQIGFGGDLLPDPVRRASANHLRAVCEFEPSGRIRPSLAALILAATDVPGHPMLRLAQTTPRWLIDIDTLASVAGAAVHKNSADDLNLLQQHLQQCADALNALQRAMG